MSNENLPKLLGVKGYFVFDEVTGSADVYQDQSGDFPGAAFYWDGAALYPMVQMPDHKYYVDADKTITDPRQQEHILVFKTEEIYPTVNGKIVSKEEAAKHKWDEVRDDGFYAIKYRGNFELDNPYVNSSKDGFGEFLSLDKPGEPDGYSDADYYYAVSNALQSYAFFNFDKDKLSFAKAVQAFQPLGSKPEPPYKNEYVEPTASRSVKNPSAPADASKAAPASNNAKADTSKSAPASNSAKADTAAKANASNPDPKAAGGNDGSAAKTDTNAKASTDSKADTSAKASADSKADTDKKGKN